MVPRRLLDPDPAVGVALDEDGVVEPKGALRLEGDELVHGGHRGGPVAVREDDDRAHAWFLSGTWSPRRGQRWVAPAYARLAPTAAVVPSRSAPGVTASGWRLGRAPRDNRRGRTAPAPTPSPPASPRTRPGTGAGRRPPRTAASRSSPPAPRRSPPGSRGSPPRRGRQTPPPAPRRRSAPATGWRAARCCWPGPACGGSPRPR